MSAVTYHLWLKPSGEVRDRLAALIQQLAGQLGTPAFEPHVTLLGSLVGTEPDHLRRADQLARQLRVFKVAPTEPGYLAEHFRCLFMLITQTPAIMGANAVARRIFGGPPDNYMPHLSLVYGSLPQARKKEIIEVLPNDVRTSFEVRAVRLVKAGSDDPRDWQEIQVFPFSAS